MLAALVLGLAPAQARDAALEREWWVRAVARAPTTQVEELRRELTAEGWRKRASALDALARAAEAAPLSSALADELGAAARQALADPHPSVRARALAGLGALGQPIPAPDAARLARDPLASVRMALASALEFAPSPARAERLGELARDADERVRTLARNALCGLEPDEEGVGAARLALLETIARAEDLFALALFGQALAAAPLDAAWLASARAACAGLDAPRRALLEAVAFAHGESGDARVLVSGALLESAWEPAGARLFALAARSGSPELGEAVLAALVDRGALADSGAARRGLIGLLLDTLADEAPAFLGARALEPMLLAEPALLAELLGELGLRRDAWDEGAVAHWTAPPCPLAVRRALLAALAGGFVRSPSAGVARLLARFLSDPEPELAARAFELLCGAEALAPELDALLYARWSALDPAARSARLAWFSRARPLPAFVPDWLALGAADVERRASLCELLGVAGEPVEPALRARVVSGLEAWLAEDLARVAAERRPERALEQRVQAELRALARVTDGTPAQPFRAAMRAALGRSTEIGKVAVAALGRSAEGRAELAELLRAGALEGDGERRTRIEACLVLARASVPAERAAPCARLLADRTGAAWELRERMLEALGASGLPAVRAELARLALEPELEPVERVALVGFLTEHGEAPARAALLRLAREPFEFEARRVALRALGDLGESAALTGLFDELRQGRLAGSSEELPLLRAELLLALGELPDAPLELCEEWLQAPLAHAAVDLERRYAGLELAATDFAWRPELELARQLARSGRAGACLARGEVWERLDARTLLALGEALEEHEPEAAERLLAAGVSGLLGEPDPDAGLLAWARARRLALTWRLGRFEPAAALAARTLSARRAGQLSDSRWTQLFGAFERTARVDPDARVRAALWQARARLALAEGERTRAQDAAERAARAVGLSRRAHEVQAELAGELDGELVPPGARQPVAPR